MVAIDICTAAIFDNDTVEESIEQAASLSVPAVEFYDWEAVDIDAVRESADENDVTIVATLSAGVGANTGHLDQPSITDPERRDDAVADIERSLEAAVDLGAESLVVTVGPDRPQYSARTQRAAIVDVLSAVAPAAEDAGVTIVVEPLNEAVAHPGYFLTESDEAFEIVERVDSPNVKILYDIYHQQVTEGDIIRTIRDNIEHIGHIHVADVPGRNEPGTGELDFATIFDAIDDTGYDGYVGLEFGPLGDPEDVVRDVLELAE
jgi:hydroxypyruvate isomerase